MKKTRIGRISKTMIRKTPPIVEKDFKEPDFTLKDWEQAYKFWLEKFSHSPWYKRLWSRVRECA